MFISRELKCNPSDDVAIGYVMKTCTMCGDTFMVPMDVSLNVVDCCDNEACIDKYNTIVESNKLENDKNDKTQSEIDKAIGK